MHSPELLHISKEVSTALASGRGIVALESTIITHGMPYPDNVTTAVAVETAVRRAGATPATIAVVDGVLRVGLDTDEIDRLGQATTSVEKISRQNIGVVVADEATGGTTVAGTMLIASMAGIRVFATGGIGGVHVGATQTFDISADLQELARTKMVVVSAGFKSILDLGLTLEYLETHGVAVVGYQTDIVPAFYTRESSFRSTAKADSPNEIGRIVTAYDALGLTAGIVVANPIPQDHSLDAKVAEAAISAALAEADANGVSGKALTPYLLSKVSELTGEASLESNIELVVNNAKVAAQIATVLAT